MVLRTVWKGVHASREGRPSGSRKAGGDGARDDHGLDPLVVELLKETKLLEVCGPSFEAEGVDIEALSCLTDGNLQALGVTRLGDRRKMVARAKAVVDAMGGLARTVGGGAGEESGEEDKEAAQAVARTAAQRDPNCGKPIDGWGEWEEDDGVYRGEWVDGKQHGRGKYVWRSGVKYEGEWYAGRPHGVGQWAFDKSAAGASGRNKMVLAAPRPHEFRDDPTDDAQASGYDIAVHPEGLPHQMDDNKFASRSEVAGFRVQKTAADLERVARTAASWWPVVPRLSSEAAANEAAAKFFKRVLKEGSQVRVLAVMDLPHGWGEIKKPTLQREIWVHDPARQAARRGDEEPLVVVHVRFNSAFAVSPPASLPRGDDSTILGGHINLSLGVTKKASVWEKCAALNAQEDVGSRAIPIPNDRKHWRWRDEAGWGFDGGCQAKPPCDVDEGDEDICAGCASAAGLHRLLEMSEHCKKCVRGVALPLSVLEVEALAKLQCTAVIICAAPEGSEAWGDAVALREALNALRWSTVVLTNPGKFEAEHFISEFSESIKHKGSCLFVYIGRGVRLRDGSVYMIPAGVEMPKARYRLNDEDWEIVVQDTCVSLNWAVSHFAGFRDSVSKPTVFLLDLSNGAGSFGRTTEKLPAKFTQRVRNSAIVVCDPKGDPPIEAGDGGMLRLLVSRMYEKGCDMHRLLVNVRADLEARGRGKWLTCEYSSLTEQLAFKPLATDVPDRIRQDRGDVREIPTRAPRLYLGERRGLNLEEVCAFHESFGMRYVCGLPLAAIAGNQDMQMRKVHLPALAGKTADCIEYLESRFSHETRTCILHGPPGCGKTTIAAEMVRTRLVKEGVTGLFWLRCCDGNALYNDVLRLVTYLGLARDLESHPRSILARLRRWLSSHKGWFLVLDGVKDPSLLDSLWIPEECGSVLVTSVSAIWGTHNWMNVVELGYFTQDEAFCFVKQCLPDIMPIYVGPLARLLDHFPLAIAIAVAYSREFDVPPEKVSALLAAEEKKHAAAQSGKEDGLSAAHRALHIVINWVCEEVRDLSPATYDLLRICALAHSTGIRRSFLQEHPEEFELRAKKVVPCTPDWDGMLNGMASLVRLACVTSGDSDAYEMSPLVQRAVRAHIYEGEAPGLLARILSQGFENFQSADKAQHPRVTMYAPHAIAANDLRGTCGWAGVEEVVLWGVADYLAEVERDMDGAKKLYQQLFDQVSARAEKHEAVSAVLTRQAGVLDALSKHEEALFVLQEARGLLEKNNTESWELRKKEAAVLRNIARYNESLARYQEVLVVVRKRDQEAEQAKERAELEAEARLRKEREEGINHRETIEPQADAKNDDEKELLREKARWWPYAKAGLCEMLLCVADVERESGKLSESVAHYLEGFDLCGKRPAEKHLAAAFLLGVGSSYLSMEKYDDALRVLEEAVEIEALRMGEDCLLVAEARRRLGEIKYKQGHFSRSVEFLEQARRVYETKLGNEHGLVGEVCNLLGVVYDEIKQWDQALYMYTEALRIFLLNDDVESLFKAHNNAAVVRRKKEDFDGALRDYTSALEAGRKIKREGGASLRDITAIHSNMGALHLAQNHFIEALQAFTRAHEECAKYEGEESLGVASSAENIASVYYAQGQYMQALTWYAESYRIKLQCVGSSHPQTAKALWGLGLTFEKLGNFSESVTRLEQVLQIHRMSLGDSHLDCASVLVDVGVALMRDERYKKALAKFDEAFSIRRVKLGAKHPDVAVVHRSSGDTLLKMGDSREAVRRLNMALFIQDAALGKGHGDTLATLVALEKALVAERERVSSRREAASNRVVQLEDESGIPSLDAKAGTAQATAMERLEEEQADLDKVSARLDQIRERLAGTAAGEAYSRAIIQFEAPRQGSSRVRIQGLVKGAAFNGRMGHVLGLYESAEKMRFRVRIDTGEEMNVLPENLEHIRSESRGPELGVGRVVRVAGLRKAVEYNGLRARVVRSVEDGQRYVVRMEETGRELKLLAENLDAVPPPGLAIGQRVRVRGLLRKVKFNGLCGSVIGADWNDEERVIVGLDVGGELKIKASNIDLVGEDTLSEFEPGRRIRLKGLKNKEHLNGQLGTVQYKETIVEGEERLVVLLDSSEEIKVKKEMCDALPTGNGLLAPFKRVRLHSLQKAPHLNSHYGTVKSVEGKDGEKPGRIIVVLDGGFELAVKAGNLDVL